MALPRNRDIVQGKYTPNRIRELRLERGLTLDALLARMNAVSGADNDVMSTANLSKLEKGDIALTLDKMLILADALQVEVQALFPAGRAGRMLPVIGSIAAGNWREAIHEPTGHQAVPSDVETGVNSFVLRPEGDSMDKIVGDDGRGYIVVDPDQKDLLNNQLYAMQNGDGDATFKQFMADPPRLEPCSTNPVHQPIPLGREPIIVIGRVTYSGRKH